MQTIEPLFDFDANGSAVLIHQSQAEIAINNQPYKGNGEVWLELLPSSHIAFYGYFQNVPIKDAMYALVEQYKISYFSMNNRQIEGFKLSAGGNGDSQSFNLKWCPQSEPICGVGDESTQISYLIFHLFNFVDLVGNRHSIQQEGETMNRIEHVDLICDQWEIELQSLISTEKALKKLKEEGGYQLTHVGKIKRANSKVFSGKEAQACWKILRLFLSFAKGGWCEPICVVGFDESNNRAWEFWSSPIESWHVPFTWFDPHTGSQLACLYPLFMKKMKDPDWHKAFDEIIYWYLNANNSSRGTDAGIILTQAAIERLSYEYVVKDKKLLSTQGFKDLRASDKLRLLFSSLKIPLDIPKSTLEIAKVAKNFQWVDAAHALTDIRNSLVHPENKKYGKFDSVCFEAWNLGLWYLAMGLLAVCDYSGTYSNRLGIRI